MNERIKQLMDQAGIDVEAVENLGEMPTALKFAELIIKECATVQHKRFCEHGDVSWDILMEHFGVKE